MVGKCLVLSLSDFQKVKAVDIPEEDVFVCDSRYMARHRFFKKMKVGWLIVVVVVVRGVSSGVVVIGLVVV